MSIIWPCIFGIIAPPTIAITSPAAPNFDSSSVSPLSERPYIVGNITDIKNETITKEYNPNSLLIKITPHVKKIANDELMYISISGLIDFKR